MAKPHRTVIKAGEKPDLEQDQIDTPLNALKQKLKQEFAAETSNTTPKQYKLQYGIGSPG